VIAITAMPLAFHLPSSGFCLASWQKPELESGVLHAVNWFGGRLTRRRLEAEDVVLPCLPQSKIVASFNTARVRRKRLLDSRIKNVVNRPASGLVRFSYKLSVFQIVGLVICRPETTGV
jgi:hypothetical protein